MKKKQFIFSFLVVACLIDVFDVNRLSAQNSFDNYITISNGHFQDGNNAFYPVCINYLVDYAQCIYDECNGEYYIAPLFNYSDTGSGHKETKINDILYNWHWCYGTNGQDEMNNARTKLNRDLERIDSLGFNVVRLRPMIYWKNDSLRIPTRSYAKYFELTDTLIAQCARNNLRVIMVLSDDTNTYKQFDQYCVYLDSVTRHYSTNKTVMAYVVYMEPSWKWKHAHVNDKIMISNWSRKWYYLIKKNAPNQLVTYGLDGLSNILTWDPSALTYDFLSMHFYHNNSNVDTAKNGVHTYFKWMNDNVEDVWVLGETGFSATQDSCITDPRVGTDSAQFQYADFTIKMSLGCGCKGYAWWQYQDVKWSDCMQDHLGLLTRYPNEHLKNTTSPFHIFSYQYIPMYPCIKPSCYYNIPGDLCESLHGIVIDENSNPIKDALVKAWSSTSKTQYSTFTDNQGEYTIHTPADTVLKLVWVSQKGYTSSSFFPTGVASYTTKLTRINYNRWKKNWTNRNYPMMGDNFGINNSDTIVVGNFCGDEAHELLVVKFSTSRASLYTFHLDHWEHIWTGTIGGWVIRSIDKFSAGDFDGDGYDELLCLQNVSGSWVSIFRFSEQNLPNPWQYFWTNMGSGYIGNWYIVTGDVILPGNFSDSTYASLICIRNQSQTKSLLQRFQTNSWSWSQIWFNNSYIGSWLLSGVDKYYVGDFSGDGIDELLCVQVTGGTSDWMKLIQKENFWTTLWTNNGQSGNAGINPYRGLLHVGNFDQDSADELIGIGSWATKFDLNTSNEWSWSWSTYESGRLSDWSVNPNHRIFFMRTMTDVPDYLFVGRWYNYAYYFYAYSYDP